MFARSFRTRLVLSLSAVVAACTGQIEDRPTLVGTAEYDSRDEWEPNDFDETGQIVSGITLTVETDPDVMRCESAFRIDGDGTMECSDPSGREGDAERCVAPYEIGDGSGVTCEPDVEGGAGTGSSQEGEKTSPQAPVPNVLRIVSPTDGATVRQGARIAVRVEYEGEERLGYLRAHLTTPTGATLRYGIYRADRSGRAFERSLRVPRRAAIGDYEIVVLTPRFGADPHESAPVRFRIVCADGTESCDRDRRGSEEGSASEDPPADDRSGTDPPADGSESDAPSDPSLDPPSSEEPSSEEPSGEEPSSEEPSGAAPPSEDDAGETPTGDDEPESDPADDSVSDDSMDEPNPADDRPPLAGCGNPVESEVLRLANEAREAEGRAPLECDDGLTRAARLHSQDMCDNGYFSHSSLDGRSFTDRIDAQGVRWRTAGENIAWGQRSAAAVHDAWMHSSGHRANIVSTRYGRIGIGYVECGGRPYWTQDFAD